jgi:hypothetical protein
MLPAGLLDPHDLPFGSEFADTNAASLEKTEIAAGTAAQLAAVVHADPLVHFFAFGLKFLFEPLGLDAERQSCHKLFEKFKT